MIGNPHLPKAVSARLTQIALAEIRRMPSGPYLSSDFENAVLAIAQAENLPIDIQDVRQEHRDMAGYP